MKNIETSVDASEIDTIMKKLEEMEDQALAVELLKEFNDKTKELGILIMNMNPDLSNDEWKKKCDQAKTDVDEVVQKIMSV